MNNIESKYVYDFCRWKSWSWSKIVLYVATEKKKNEMFDSIVKIKNEYPFVTLI